MKEVRSNGASKVVTLRMKPSALEKWMHQNKAEYTGAFVEGCLLDSFVLSCKRGFAAVYAHVVNEWTSDYIVEFEAGKAETVWSRWCEFQERSERSA